MQRKQRFGEFTGVKRKGGYREKSLRIVALYSALYTLMKKESYPYRAMATFRAFCSSRHILNLEHRSVFRYFMSLTCTE
jgi:hypothetical protein